MMQVASMTVEFFPIVSALEAVLYDGTNGADVVAGLAGSTFTSDAGGVLDFVDHYATPQQFTAPWYLYRNLDGTLGGAAEQLGAYLDLASAIAQYAPELMQSEGTTSVPASTLGLTDDYDVTMSPALPHTDYVPVATLRGAPNVLSGHGILSVTVIDEDTVRVQVQSGALSLSGCTVHVAAVALAAA